MYPWTFELTDLTGVSYGTLDTAKDRVVDFPHNAARTAAFTLPVSANDKALRQVNLISTGLALVKAYRGSTLMFHGPIVGVSRVGDATTRSLAVNAMDSMFFLDRRYLEPLTILDSTTAQGLAEIKEHTYESPQPPDSAEIARNFIIDMQYFASDGTTIQTTNNKYNVGIWIGSRAVNSGYSMSYTYSIPGVPVGEMFRELSASASGFDWRLDPIQYGAHTNVASATHGAITAPAIVELVTAAVIGQQRPNCSFDYGTGHKNLVSAELVVSRETMANSVGHLNNAIPTDPFRSVEATFTTAESASLGFALEAIVESDLTDATSRVQLANLHLALRRDPRRTLSMVPAVYNADQPQHVPQFERDWDVGDWVRAKGKDASGLWFDGWTRIWGATFKPDNNGVERVELTLVPDEV